MSAAEAPWLQALAGWCAQEGLGELPGIGPALANSSLDWVGALLSGPAHPLYVPYIDGLAALCQPHGPAGFPVIGDDRAWPLAEAAAANAAISHFWEVDDVHRDSTMHPGIAVYPVVVVLALAGGAPDFARLRGAVVAGYEAGTRIGAFLGPKHYAISHTTATAGSFAAAAAAAHMLGLSAEQTLWAFGHAGTQASGLWQFLDDGAIDAKPFHGASPVRNGLTAAFLAQAGIAGASRILEGPRGMLAAWQLAPSEAARAVLTPGGTIELTRSSIKGWPVCGQMHSLLDATLALLRTQSVPVEHIARIQVEAPSSLGKIADVRDPQSLAALKFSTRACVAILLLGGDLAFAGLDEAWLTDPRVKVLADKTEISAPADFDARFPKERPARLTLHVTDGTVLQQERSFRRGDPEDPWVWPDLVRRFRDISQIAGTQADVQDKAIAWANAFGAADIAALAKQPLFGIFPPV